MIHFSIRWTRLGLSAKTLERNQGSWQ